MQLKIFEYLIHSRLNHYMYIFCTKNPICTFKNTQIEQLFFDYTISIWYSPRQIRMDIVYQKIVLNVSFQDFLCTNMNNHLI